MDSENDLQLEESFESSPPCTCDSVAPRFKIPAPPCPDLKQDPPPFKLAISKSRSPCISKKNLYLIWQNPLLRVLHFKDLDAFISQKIVFQFTSALRDTSFQTDSLLHSTYFKFPFPQLLRFKKHHFFMIYLIPSFTSALRGTAYCMGSVTSTQSPISISLVSFQRNVAKETLRTRSSIER